MIVKCLRMPVLSRKGSSYAVGAAAELADRAATINDIVGTSFIAQAYETNEVGVKALFD